MLCPGFFTLTACLLLFHSAPALSYICTAAHGLLPTPRDCHELLDAIEALSRTPPYNNPMLWSRHVEDSTTSQKLPKAFWIQGREPGTCTIHVDVVPYGDLNAEDTFPFQNLANVGEILVEQCLIRRRKLGLAYPGMRENVEARIVRTSALLLEGKVGGVRSLKRWGNGMSLFEVTVRLEKALIGIGRNVSNTD